jgi:hypothetical protein
MSDATIEVDGEVYALTSATYYEDEAIEGMTQTGRRVTGYRGEPLIEAHVSGWAFADVIMRADYRGHIPCRVTLDGATFDGIAWATEWTPDPPVTQLRVERLKIAPPTPTLDEPTAPADIDWSEIRSATEARDWRRAWQAVGTDHAGDATPGETYLLSKAARAKATAAALVAWRKVEMDAGTIFIGADAARVWERIKRIAGWTSQAAAQYKPRTKSAKQTRAEWLNERIRPGAIQLPDDILGGRYSTVNVGDFVVDDDVGSFEQALALSLVDYRAADEDAAMTRGNGGVTGTMTMPGTTSRSIAAMLATQARLTGGARLNIGTEDESITITPSSNMIRWQRPDPAAATSHVGIATHATNPNPRGPQPRRRSRT